MYALALNALLQLLGGCVFGIGLLGGERVARVQTVADAAIRRLPPWLVGKWSPNINQELRSLEVDVMENAPPEALGAVRVGLHIGVVLEHAFTVAYGIFLAFCALALFFYVLDLASPGPLLPPNGRLTAALFVWAFSLGFHRLVDTIEFARLKTLDGVVTEVLDPMNLHMLVILATFLFIGVSRHVPSTWSNFLTWVGFTLVLAVAVAVAVEASILVCVALNLALRTFTRVALMVLGALMYARARKTVGDGDSGRTGLFSMLILHQQGGWHETDHRGTHRRRRY